MELAEFVAGPRARIEDLLRPSAWMTRCLFCTRCGIDESLMTFSSSIGESPMVRHASTLSPSRSTSEMSGGYVLPCTLQLAVDVGHALARHPLDLRLLTQHLPKDDAFRRFASEKT